MKKKIILFTTLLLVCIVFFGFKKIKKKLVLIEGYVTNTGDYCGGAAPPEEMLEQLRIPKPYVDKEMFIKIGAKNKSQNPFYKKIKTNHEGYFSVMLSSETTYCFIEDWKAKPFKPNKNTEFINWDTACLYERYLLADYVINVNRFKNEKIKINFHKPCFYNPYCGTYSGPLPP